MTTNNQAFQRYITTTRTLITDIESVYEHNPTLAHKLARMIEYNNHQLTETLNHKEAH